MSLLTVVAKVKAKKESVETVKSELLKLIAPTRRENGCIAYNLHQDNEDPAVFIFYETWESSACLEKHMGADHFKDCVSVISPLLEEQAVHIMTRIE